MKQTVKSWNTWKPYFHISQTSSIQKQPPEVFCERRCSWKFRKIHRKTPAPESLLSKVAGLRHANLLKKRLAHRCLPVNFAKFLRIPFYRTPLLAASVNNGDSKILLIENEEIINQNIKVAKVFNFYFESVTECLDFFDWASEPYDQAKDAVERIIQRFSLHPSIIRIRQSIKALTIHTSDS